MKSYIPFLFLVLIFPFCSLSAQSVSLAVGGTVSHAPELAFNGSTGSSRLFTAFGDMVINDNLIGRIQYTSMDVSSLESKLADRVNFSWSANGSIGYNLVLGPQKRIQIPILLSGGIALINYDGFGSEYGAQFGGSISPFFQFTKHLGVMGQFRVMRGSDMNDGAVIHSTDIGLGLRFRLL
ncbi:MAG: hypothetical protein AAF206_04845 [Bacteroidota bacterium]